MGKIGLYQPLDRTHKEGVVSETFLATEHVASPWGPMQHGGPVAALLTRAMDRLRSRPDSRISRVTVDLLGPVPLGEVRVVAEVVRPGRRVELTRSVLEARDRDGEWREFAHGSAWRLATQPTDDVVHRADPVQSLPSAMATDLDDHEMPDAWQGGGFVGSVEWRLAHLGAREGEPTVAWVNLTRPLVEGETPSDLERIVALADTTNGIGARLDPGRFVFLNTEMTVHLHRAPAGQWYGLEAETSVGPDGIGMSAGVIHSEDGPIGRVAQSLLVERVARG